MKKLLSLLSIVPFITTSCGSKTNKVPEPEWVQSLSYLDNFVNMNDLTLDLPDSVADFKEVNPQYIQNANFSSVSTSYTLKKSEIENYTLKSETFENTRKTASHLSLNSKIIQATSKYIGNNWKSILSNANVKDEQQDSLLIIDNVVGEVKAGNTLDIPCFKVDAKLKMSSIMPTTINYCVKGNDIISKINVNISGFAEDKVFKHAKFMGDNSIEYYFVGSISEESSLLESAYIATNTTGNNIFSAEIKEQKGMTVISSGTKVRVNVDGAWEHSEKSTLATFHDGNLFGAFNRKDTWPWEDGRIEEVADNKGNRILEQQIRRNTPTSSLYYHDTSFFPSGLTNWKEMDYSYSSYGSKGNIRITDDTNASNYFTTGGQTYWAHDAGFYNYKNKQNYENRHGEIVSSDTHYPSLRIKKLYDSSYNRESYKQDSLDIPNQAKVKLLPFENKMQDFHKMLEEVTVDQLPITDINWATAAYQEQKHYIDLI